MNLMDGISNETIYVGRAMVPCKKVLLLCTILSFARLGLTMNIPVPCLPVTVQNHKFNVDCI